MPQTGKPLESSTIMTHACTDCTLHLLNSARIRIYRELLSLHRLAFSIVNCKPIPPASAKAFASARVRVYTGIVQSTLLLCSIMHIHPLRGLLTSDACLTQRLIHLALSVRRQLCPAALSKDWLHTVFHLISSTYLHSYAVTTGFPQPAPYMKSSSISCTDLYLSAMSLLLTMNSSYGMCGGVVGLCAKCGCDGIGDGISRSLL